jgi:hypothetical protein
LAPNLADAIRGEGYGWPPFLLLFLTPATAASEWGGRGRRCSSRDDPPDPTRRPWGRRSYDRLYARRRGPRPRDGGNFVGPRWRRVLGPPRAVPDRAGQGPYPRPAIRPPTPSSGAGPPRARRRAAAGRDFAVTSAHGSPGPRRRPTVGTRALNRPTPRLSFPNGGPCSWRAGPTGLTPRPLFAFPPGLDAETRRVLLAAGKR